MPNMLYRLTRRSSIPRGISLKQVHLRLFDTAMTCLVHPNDDHASMRRHVRMVGSASAHMVKDRMFREISPGNVSSVPRRGDAYACFCEDRSGLDAMATASAGVDET